jgi:hypothetical protein
VNQDRLVRDGQQGGCGAAVTPCKDQALGSHGHLGTKRPATSIPSGEIRAN